MILRLDDFTSFETRWAEIRGLLFSESRIAFEVVIKANPLLRRQTIEHYYVVVLTYVGNTWKWFGVKSLTEAFYFCGTIWQ